MVHHAKDLPRIAGNQEPSTYVKVYLLPDHNKATKRKTKVVKKNCYPSFMEMVRFLVSVSPMGNVEQISLHTSFTFGFRQKLM